MVRSLIAGTLAKIFRLGDVNMEKALEIKENYNKQIDNIINYVDLLEDYAGLPTSFQVKSLVNEIKQYDCSDEVIEKNIDDIDTIIKVVLFSRNSIGLLNKVKGEYRDIISNLENYDQNLSVIHQELFDWSYDHIGTDYGNQFDGIKKKFTYQDVLNFSKNYLLEFINNTYTIDNIINEDQYGILIEHKESCWAYGVKKIYDSFIEEINLILYRINHYNMLVKLNDSENVLNNYRQSFILLMSTLDATIFDLSEVVLKTDFFKYAVYFCPKKNKSNKSINYSDFSDFTNKEEFFDNVIKEILKPKYIKDLISDYERLKINKIIKEKKEIIEMINRRNVHLHNNGIADEKYIGDINIYGFSIGDILPIDKEYYNRALELSNLIICSLTDFIQENI